MTVTLLKPYAGQLPGTLYTGPDEAILLAEGIASQVNLWGGPPEIAGPRTLTVVLRIPYAGQLPESTYSGPDASILLALGYAHKPTSTVNPLPILTLTGPLTYATNAAAGTLVANIGNVPNGVTPTITPNDGRLVVAGNQTTGWTVVTGMSASSAGVISLTVQATGATPATQAVTVTVALTALRATNAGFAPVLEQPPASGIAQTTRAVLPAFVEPFQRFQIVYATFRIRLPSFTASVDTTGLMTVTALSAGGIPNGFVLLNAGLATGTYVKSQVSVASGYQPGSLGTYQLSVAPGSAVASTTITGAAGWLTEELFQGAGAQATFETGWADIYTPGYTNLPARQRVTYNSGAPSFAYNYATWNPAVGHFVSDIMSRATVSNAPMELWTRVTLPSNGFGIPINKLAQNVFLDRGWGVDLQTSGTSVDPIAGTSIPQCSTTSATLSQGIVPVAIICYTAGGASTIVGIGDSRMSATGLGINEPAGYGDKQGDINGCDSEFMRGAYLSGQHFVSLGKPSEKAYNLSRSPGAWKYRLALMGALQPKVAFNALGQNDQNPTIDVMAAYASGMDCPLGTTITTTANNIYIVTAAGTGGTSAPTGTTVGAPITFGTATIQYLGNSTDQDTRMGMAMTGKNLVINNAIRAAIPGITITQDALSPFSSSSDNWASAGNQTAGFHVNAGIVFGTQLSSVGASISGADRFVSQLSFSGGSSTTNGGAYDNLRRWLTASAVTAYFLTQDGIHRGNYGAEVAKVAYTKSAFGA